MLKRVLSIDVIDDVTHTTITSLDFEMDSFLSSAHDLRHISTHDGFAYFAIESHNDEIIDYVQLFRVGLACNLDNNAAEIDLVFDQNLKFNEIKAIKGNKAIGKGQQAYATKVFLVPADTSPIDDEGLIDPSDGQDSKNLVFYLINMKDDWTTSVAIARFDKRTFEFVSTETIMTDIKEYVS